MELTVESLDSPALTKAQLADLLFDEIGLNKRESKEMLKSWSCSVLPPDHHRWKLREEDNWLDEETPS